MKLKFMPFHFMHNYYYNVTICKMMESKKLTEMNIKYNSVLFPFGVIFQNPVTFRGLILGFNRRAKN